MGPCFYWAFSVPGNALRPGRWPHDLRAFRFARATAPTSTSLDPTAARAEGPDVRGGHMALADRVNTDSMKRRPSGLPCSVAKALATWPTKDAQAFQWMMDEGWSVERIYAEIVAGDEGYEVGKQTISRHRSKSCRCFL